MAVVQEQNKRVRIIVADDNKEMRDTVMGLLERDFDIVSTVGDGRALVEEVEALDPEIGIVDISMPLMNGIMAAGKIKSNGSKMKVIFLTVNEDRDFVRAAFEVGASAYVVKRQMASDLLKALEEVIAGRRFISGGCDISDSLTAELPSF